MVFVINNGHNENGVFESGGVQLSLEMENPQMRWAFIRKICVILSMQSLLTDGVAAVMVFVPPISHFIVSTRAGLALYIVVVILPFILLRPLYSYHKRYPINFILLGLFTITISSAVGMSCAFAIGKIILEAAILTSIVVVSLTLYTFWAVKRGHDFSILELFLFCILLVLFVFSLIQIFLPLGKLSVMVYSGLAALILIGYILYDIDTLIERFKYDEYVWASISLYLDIKNPFLALLSLLGIIDS